MKKVVGGGALGRGSRRRYSTRAASLARCPRGAQAMHSISLCCRASAPSL